MIKKIVWIYIEPFSRPKDALHSRMNATQTDKRTNKTDTKDVCSLGRHSQ